MVDKDDKSHSHQVSFVKLAETSPTAITKVDNEGKIVYANSKAEEVLGIQKSNITSRKYNDPAWKITDNEGNEMPVEKLPFQMVKNSKQSVSDVRHAIEIPDGERKIVSVNASPLFDDEENFDGMVAVIRDITDQYRMDKYKTSILRELKERNKELSLLYEMANLSVNSDISLKEFLQKAVEKVPPAWQYPETTCARITYGSEEFTTDNFRVTSWSQISPIEVDGKKVGTLEIYYLDEMPEADEGPFLKNERDLIDSLTKVLGHVISDREAKRKKDHLNSLLRSVREIDQSIIQTDEKTELIEEACKKLAKNSDYEHSWIVLLDDFNRVLNSAQSGLGKDFNEILNQIKAGELPSCLQEALEQSGVVVVEDPAKECDGCFISEDLEDHSLLIAKLASEGKIYGAISAAVTKKFAESEEERSLFGEIAQNIGFGLENLENQKNLKKRESQLKKSQEIADVGSWEIDMKIDDLTLSDEACRIFGISPEENRQLESEDFLGLIHPEDLDSVQEEWQKTKEGGSYDLEHRIVVDGETKWVRGKAEASFDQEGNPEKIIGTVQDITNRKKAEMDLLKSEKKFRSYVENAPVGVFIVDEQGNYLEVNEAACKLTGYSEDELVSMNFEDLHPPGHEEIIQKAFEDLQETGEMSTELPYKRKDETEGFFLLNAVELSEDRFLGFTLDITKRKEYEKRLEEATIGALEALNRTIEAKDEYTGEHIDRVQKYSVTIGKHFGLSDDRIQQLKFASILHDVGKIGISDAILGKPGKLTDEEWELMEKHPKIGERIVGKVDRLERAAKIIGQHQEKYDGSGYPEGLKGNEITLEARIIAVADAWDAMTTDRPYRDALSKKEAIKELKENSGSQFDPEVVKVMLELLKRGGREW